MSSADFAEQPTQMRTKLAQTHAARRARRTVRIATSARLTFSIFDGSVAACDSRGPTGAWLGKYSAIATAASPGCPRASGLVPDVRAACVASHAAWPRARQPLREPQIPRGLWPIHTKACLLPDSG